VKLHLLALLSLALASCAPKGLLVNPIVRGDKPPVQQSASPTVDEAQIANTQSNEAVKKARLALQRAKAATASTQAALNKSVVEVDRLLKQKSASEQELTNLRVSVVEQATRVIDISNELASTEVALSEQRTLSQVVATKLMAAQKQIQAKDAEAAEVRRLLKTSEETADGFQKTAATATDLLAKAQSEVDIEKGKVHLLLWSTGILGVILLIIVIWFFVKLSRRAALPIPFL